MEVLSAIYKFSVYIWHIKTSTQNSACSQRQIHTVHTCKLSQGKTSYQKTFIPIEYKLPLPSHPFLKFKLLNVEIYTETERERERGGGGNLKHIVAGGTGGTEIVISKHFQLQSLWNNLSVYFFTDEAAY